MKRIKRETCVYKHLWLRWLLFAAALTTTGAAAEDSESINEYAGAPINRITIHRNNVFNLDDQKENYGLYRLVNQLHIVTREPTVRNQLLFKQGDPFDPRLIQETERILRDNKYFYDASLTAKPTGDGSVDIDVTTRDVWTLMPEIRLTRKGGENRTVLGIEEANLLGYGQRVVFTYSDDIDRRSTTFEYSDRQIGTSWVALGLRVADNSDGHSRLVNIIKPFHALDARRAGGVSVFDDDRRSALYTLGEEAAEFRHERQYYSAFGGISSGLRDGWVRRWTLGVIYDDNRFSEAREPTLPQVIPADRKLVYPYIGFDILQDQFEKSANTDQIERSEDFYLGTRLSASLGWSDTGFGADRDALVYSLNANRSFGTLQDRALLLALSAAGRLESGDAVNTSARLIARYFSRQSEKRLFFILLDMLAGHDRDIDSPVEIGGNSGLRGYPLRYQSGDSRMLLTVEQRYYTDWYPFRLFRVGGAVFVDGGRTWGRDPLGNESLGWLTNVGFGLRFAPTRFGTRKVIHLDIAFPLDGDPSIDDVQVSFEAKRSF